MDWSWPWWMRQIVSSAFLLMMRLWTTARGFILFVTCWNGFCVPLISCTSDEASFCKTIHCVQHAVAIRTKATNNWDPLWEWGKLKLSGNSFGIFVPEYHELAPKNTWKKHHSNEPKMHQTDTWMSQHWKDRHFSKGTQYVSRVCRWVWHSDTYPYRNPWNLAISNCVVKK